LVYTFRELKYILYLFVPTVSYLRNFHHNTIQCNT